MEDDHQHEHDQHTTHRDQHTRGKFFMENTGSDSEVESMSTTRVGRRSGTPTTPTPTATTARRRSFPIPIPPETRTTEGTRTTASPPPPPSSYTYPFQPYPFQAYPGNPDPGTPIPNTGYYGGYSRRSSSMESLSVRRRSGGFSEESAHSNSGVGVNPPASLGHGEEEVLGRPVAPFMTNGRGRSPRNTLYRNSAAAATLTTKGSSQNLSEGTTSRPGSMIFRAPFLSPASRNSSTVWTPPAYTPQQAHPHSQQHQSISPSGSTTALSSLVRKGKPPVPSTLLPNGKLTNSDKPWLGAPHPRDRLAKILTYGCILLGLAGAALLCFFDLRGLDLLDESHLCVVFEDDFSGDALDTGNWKRTVALGGFGNGEFEIMTNKDENLKIQNSNLYIIPTLTSADIGGTSSIFDGYTYDLGDACTSTNTSQCSVTSSSNTTSVIPPVQSSMISTNGTHSITYGRVQVRAKLPLGDWLWPAIWMLPQNNTYGPWPLSGEIDIMEARGNAPTYPAQGTNFVRSSLNYSPLPSSLLTQIFGWWSMKQGGFDRGFHTYTLEWSPQFIRMYVDSRLQAMVELETKTRSQSFWSKGGYPAVAMNDVGAEVPVTDIWGSGDGSTSSTSGSGSTDAPDSDDNNNWSAPFNQEFYLIISLAAGGTSGWFPDNVGGKPWADGDPGAMKAFAEAQDTWSATWPTSEDDRAMRVDWVKMWKMC
ncbi:concanavalin A-like lectin/glucanase domain-containing protein [Lentinula edodes]|uniref:concanavalin A-like lectin/glucanase domain-containing protein n=1 Tax=Lentinula edodes TaxID=5353 RepID=UPI001E8DA915|nr:concanavalin A-like lectin/glucanase domain-containing protein [Lentinula edodes]KAH7867750.1 concanavalin A-like lectin/glucanase domain-containing protein [Lentinula edodes]